MRSEFQVGPPRVIFNEDDNGKKLEPVELAVVDVPEDKASRVTALMLERRGELLGISAKGDLQHLEYAIPSRGLIGLRTILPSATQVKQT